MEWRVAFSTEAKKISSAYRCLVCCEHCLVIKACPAESKWMWQSIPIHFTDKANSITFLFHIYTLNGSWHLLLMFWIDALCSEVNRNWLHHYPSTSLVLFGFLRIPFQRKLSFCWLSTVEEMADYENSLWQSILQLWDRHITFFSSFYCIQSLNNACLLAACISSLHGISCPYSRIASSPSAPINAENWASSRSATVLSSLLA